MSRILIVAAHPDDEILGCGGTISKLASNGHEAFTLILGEGITSRDEKRNTKLKAPAIKELKRQAVQANKLIGVKEVFMNDFPDNRFDTVSFLDIVKAIEKAKKKIRPEKIFTHYESDLNIDHQITQKAVITAARPLPKESVKEILSFEILSSTEWNNPQTFVPDTFFDITSTIEDKLAALSEYKSELRKFPHPRSLKGVRLNAENWGMKTGVRFAEVFKIVRSLR